MYRFVVLIPAYGRDYKKAEDAIKSWEEGKDWRIAPNGPYVSVRESRNLIQGNFTHVTLYYMKQTRRVEVPLENITLQ